MKLDHSADFKLLLDLIVPDKLTLSESSLIHSDVGQLAEL